MENSLYAKKIREIFPEAGDIEDDYARRRVTFTAYRAVRRNGTRITVGQLARLAALFSRAAREKVTVPPDLADKLEALLASRCQNLMGLARRAGLMVAGYEQVRGSLRAGKAAVLIAASDGAADGRDKIRHLAPDLPLIDSLTSAEIGAALGAGAMVHAALSDGRLAREILTTADKLGALRRGSQAA